MDKTVTDHVRPKMADRDVGEGGVKNARTLVSMSVDAR